LSPSTTVNDAFGTNPPNPSLTPILSDPSSGYSKTTILSGFSLPVSKLFIGPHTISCFPSLSRSAATMGGHVFCNGMLRVTDHTKSQEDPFNSYLYNLGINSSPESPQLSFGA